MTRASLVLWLAVGCRREQALELPPLEQPSTAEVDAAPPTHEHSDRWVGALVADIRRARFAPTRVERVASLWGPAWAFIDADTKGAVSLTPEATVARRAFALVDGDAFQVVEWITCRVALLRLNHVRPEALSALERVTEAARLFLDRPTFEPLPGGVDEFSTNPGHGPLGLVSVKERVDGWVEGTTVFLLFFRGNPVRKYPSCEPLELP
ncbi:MAG: hypothetical protein IPJ34_09040 [Myxococcales bacterium]|nr:hypothetical protein [Myxococcales bacterium]